MKASGLGQRVGRLMAAMHRYDQGGTLPLMYAAGLTTPQWAALEFVREPRSVSAVAAHLGLSLPATSQTVDRMVRLGFALRSEHPEDRRVKQVTLSRQGTAVLEKLAAARASRFNRSLSALSPAVAMRLSRALGEALAELEAAR